MSSAATTPSQSEGAEPDAPLQPDSATATPPQRGPVRPIPPKTREQQRATQIFGEAGAEPEDPSAAMFGVRELRGGRGGRQRQQSPNRGAEPARSPQARAPQSRSAAPQSAAPGGVAQEAESAAEPVVTALDSTTAPHDPDGRAPQTIAELGPAPEGMEWIEHGAKEAPEFLAVPAKFAHHFRTMAGQFKAFERRAREGVESALGWKAHAEQQQRELDALRTGGVAPQQLDPAAQPTARLEAPPADAKPRTLLETMDWATYQQLQTQNPTLAAQWLADAQDQIESYNRQVLEHQLRREYDARLNPILGDRAQQERFGKAANFFAEMAGVGDEQGAWYPELASDRQAVAEIAQIWAALPVIEEQRHSHAVFHNAYLLWRDHRDRQARAQGLGAPSRGVVAPPAPVGSTQPGASALTAMMASAAADAARAGSVVGGSAPISAPRATNSPAPTGRGAALIDAISKAGVDPARSRFGIVR